MTATRRRFLFELAAVTAALPAVTALVEATDAFEEHVRATDPMSLSDAYSLAKGVGYLNHASIGTIPTAVQEAHQKYLSTCESNPWLHMWGGVWDPLREEVRGLAARRLHCTTDEIAITRNTTEGFNLLAQGLPLGTGDEVVFSSLNHVGASACWSAQAKRRGFTVRSWDFPVDRVPTLDEDAVVALHTRQITERTRVLCLPEIDNLVGLRLPIARIAKAARSKGVRWIAVDGAQALGMVPVDVTAQGIDFYAASPHKWIQCPKGLGLFYARSAAQKDLAPMIMTWGQDRWKGSARTFEDYGTRDLPALLALGDALRFQTRLDDSRAKTYASLRGHCREHVADHPKLTWCSAGDPRLAASLHAVGIEGTAAPAVADRLFKKHGFVVRPFRTAGLNALRVSPNLVNTRDELTRFFGALAKALA